MQEPGPPGDWPGARTDVIFGLFKHAPLLDEASSHWLFDLFDWALRHFDADAFCQKTVLVLPTDAFFPGRANNPHAMAELIFTRAGEYARMAPGSIRLIDPAHYGHFSAQQVRLEGTLGQRAGKTPVSVPAAFSYDPNLLRNPEGLIASFAQQFANYKRASVPQAPPGGPENFPHADEVLAVFLGFGVMLANTASNIRVGCGGGCSTGGGREAHLSQFDLTYALAIFCLLKNIPASGASPHLKAPLRSYFKKALKEIDAKPELETLRRLFL